MDLALFRRTYLSYLFRLVPGQLIIQITDKCNARCPQCGMRTTHKFPRFSLNKKKVFRLIKAAAKRRITAISFTGGEPFLLLDDLFDYLEYAGRCKIPFIRTGTNGFFLVDNKGPSYDCRVGNIAKRLAATSVRNVWVSLDSCDPATHEKMRGFSSLVDGIQKAVPIFEEQGIWLSANLAITRNLGGSLTNRLFRKDYLSNKSYEKALYHSYCRAFAQFYETAIELGFTIANTCYPMSIDAETNQDLAPVYQANDESFVVKFSRSEKRVIFKALLDTIPKYRHRIRIFSPMCSLNALVNEYTNDKNIEEEKHLSSAPCLGGVSYFFVDACSGSTFPCGYRGNEDLGDFDLDSFLPGVERNCKQCDWECFRDPSELVDPLIGLFTSPGPWVKKYLINPDLLGLWGKDLLYYQSCGFFNGRKEPDYKKMFLASTI